MDTDTEETRIRQSVRVLLPLAWWLILVLILYAYRTHQRLLDQTVLRFSPVLQGQSIDYEVAASLDGRRVSSGGQIPLGWHTFSISHPKAELYSTNLFIWYGEHRIGEVTLVRQKGTLAIQADPPARLLTVQGPEFSVTLTNSIGVTCPVPTGRYSVSAAYGHWADQRELVVSANSSAVYRFAPRIGNLQVTCSQTNASFELVNANGQRIEAGDFPSVVKDMPEGNYKLFSSHHGVQREQEVKVKAGILNCCVVEFSYGAAELESEPTDAAVEDKNGRYVGNTPLHLSELQPGRFDFVVRHNGYESGRVSLDIVANETNHSQVALVNSDYLRALNSAREYLQAKNYDRALESAGEALRIKPKDPDAASIENTATKERALRRAQVFQRKGDFASGIDELELALFTLPEDKDLKQLLADFKRREEDRRQRITDEQTSSAMRVFAKTLASNADRDLFETHEIRSSKTVKDVGLAIIDAFRNAQPPFVFNDLKSTEPDTFALEFKQEWSGSLRQCLIVVGQPRPGETLVVYKVLEYTSGQPVSTLGGFLTVKSSFLLTAIHPSRVPQMTDALQAQVRDGTRIVTRLLQGAISESP